MTGMEAPMSGSDGAISPDGVAVATTRGELRRQLRAAKTGTSRASAVVMTMGALHDGHAALIDAARDLVGPGGHVTVTIFVNPLQFGANEDLDSYPRTLAADLRICRDHRADLVFAPTPPVVYPDGDPQVTIDPGVLGTRFEGAARPDHFAGVLTVVNKLLNLTKPDYALFGEKDYQQLVLIRRLVADLDVDVQIVGIPTVRASDGLALSSRNQYLNSEQRRAALAISRAIAAGQQAAAEGADADGIVQAATVELAREPVVVPEYVIVTDPMMGPAPAVGSARIILTALVGDTRLLDNAAVDIGARVNTRAGSDTGV